MIIEEKILMKILDEYYRDDRSVRYLAKEYETPAAIVKTIIKCYSDKYFAENPDVVDSDLKKELKSLKDRILIAEKNKYGSYTWGSKRESYYANEQEQIEAQARPISSGFNNFVDWINSQGTKTLDFSKRLSHGRFIFAMINN
jgi:hypothetical protein